MPLPLPESKFSFAGTRVSPQLDVVFKCKASVQLCKAIEKKIINCNKKADTGNMVSQSPPWDYHHITPIYVGRLPRRPEGVAQRGLITGLSVAALVLGILILGITGMHWWNEAFRDTRRYLYHGPDERLQGWWVATANSQNGHPVFIRTDSSGVCTYLYHGSVPSDRTLWIFSGSLDEGDDTQHIAYASGPRNSLENLDVTGNNHVGSMRPV